MTEQNQQDDFDDGFTDAPEEQIGEPNSPFKPEGRSGGLLKPLMSLVALAVVTGAGFFGYKMFLAPSEPLDLTAMQQASGQQAAGEVAPEAAATSTPTDPAMVSENAAAGTVEGTLGGAMPAPLSAEAAGGNMADPSAVVNAPVTDGQVINGQVTEGIATDMPMVGEMPSGIASAEAMPEQATNALAADLTAIAPAQVDLMADPSAQVSAENQVALENNQAPVMGANDDAVIQPPAPESMQMDAQTMQATMPEAQVGGLDRPIEMDGASTEQVTEALVNNGVSSAAVAETVTVAPDVTLTTEVEPAMPSQEVMVGGEVAKSQPVDTDISSAQVTEDMSALQQELAAKADELIALQAQNTALQREVAQLKATRAQETAVKPRQKAEKTESRKAKPPRKAKAEKRPADKARAFSEKMRAAENRVPYILRSAQPGVAWVSTEAMGDDLQEVRVGQFLKGYGQISAIVRDQDGQWVVKTQEGDIRRN
jgi:hypothetical protein